MKDPNAVTRYVLNREYYLEYEKSRRTPEYRQRQQIYQYNYYRKYRDRILSRQRVIDQQKRAEAVAAKKQEVKPPTVKPPKQVKEKKVKKSDIVFYVPEATPTFREVPMSLTENDWA
jgi:hypothetical protein